ncbi:MAG: zinc protease [Maribacter sp.]|jgi:zinc protease
MRYIILLLSLFISSFIFAQQNNLHVESYTLNNGLTIYLNEDPSANRVFGAIAVNAGSKNDPADATGIAHYLEHLLFKGTTELGTWDYTAEKIHLDSINYWYEKLGKTSNETERNSIQQQINKHSVAASKYSLPNEFDNLLKSIGSSSVNAFTSNDITFYHNSFPQNQMGKWLDIYSHRFQDPVFRSFQSELEIVYEEKNRAMDGFEYQILEKFMDGLFSPHPYGTQTTLGKTVHLKNPNLNKMYEFFNTYYVANNMALVLSGNFNIEEAKVLVAEKFGNWERGKTPTTIDFPISKIEGKKKDKVRFTPIKAAVYGFKTAGANHPDQPILDVISGLFSNGSSTGLLDRLDQDNKLTFSEFYAESLNDDGAAVFIIVPKIIIQSFRKAEKLVFNEINRVKIGDFDDALLASIKNEIDVDFQRSLEDVTQRGIAIGDCFNRGISWEEYLNYTNTIEAVTKEDIMKIAQKYYSDDYLAVYSRMGFPKKEKLEKPSFQPVKPDPSKESDYAAAFKAKKTTELSPQFMDFKNDVDFTDLKNNNRLYVTPNPINEIFSITIRYQYGNDNNRDLKLATQLMNEAGTANKNMLEVKEAFAVLGTKYNISSSRNYLSVYLEGKEENLVASLQLMNELIQQPIIDRKALKLALKEAKTNQRIDKRTPSTMGNALRFFAIYGDNSHYLRRHSITEIKSANITSLTKKFKEGTDYAASIHYTGKLDAATFKQTLLDNYQLNTSGKREPMMFAKSARYKESHVYFIHNKKAVQSQVHFYVPGDKYKKKDYPHYQAFNSYFGDGFSGLVLQEIREYRSLAYSAWGRYFHPFKENEMAFLNSFVGCQGDKTNESIDVMMSLFSDMPENPSRMPGIKSGLQQKAMTSYPSFRFLSTIMENYKKLGYRKSPMELGYPVYSDLEFSDITSFHDEHVKGKPVIITIYGDKRRIDIKALEKYGKVEELKEGDVIVF